MTRGRVISNKTVHKHIKSLREFYRREFLEGDSDKSFVSFIESTLEAINRNDRIKKINDNSK